MSLPLISASILPINNKGKFLLQLRDDIPDIFAPGMWCIFGGHLEKGEDPETAAIREFKEETGIEIKNINFLTDVEFRNYEIHEDHINRIFITKLNLPVEEIKIYEGQKGKFFSLEEAKKINLIPEHLKVLKLYAQLQENSSQVR